MLDDSRNDSKFTFSSPFFIQKNIHIVTEWITNEVSSTKVRRALRRGESVKYLVQDSVIDYIYKNALYNTHNKWVLAHIGSHYFNYLNALSMLLILLSMLLFYHSLHSSLVNS